MTAEIIELLMFCFGCFALIFGLGVGMIFWWYVLR